MPVTIDGSSGITSPAIDLTTTPLAVADGGTGLTAGENMFRNRIINGAMMIDQRNAGASVTPTSGQYTLDRWKGTSTQASKYSIQQNAGSVTPPVGFSNYLGITSLSSYSIVSGDSFSVNQVIEGLNVADLAWGTANAQTVTLSFWVRSSLTGTFGGALRNSAQNRSYPFSYTVSSANTWEQKTVTIAGDTSGTWLTTNGIGIELDFGLGVGSTYSTTAGAWAAGNYTSATGATSVVGTNGATFYITGVQLEKGSTATSFDYRPYGTELQLCQRYLPAFNATTADYPVPLMGQCYSSSQALIIYPFIVQPRVAPTGITISNASHFSLTDSTSARRTTSAFTFNNATLLGGVISATTTVNLTAGNATTLWSSNAAAQILWTGCEL